MGLYLPGADIHDFLACLGKHAVEKVSFGFSDLKAVEPECHNIVFVEDTGEVFSSIFVYLGVFFIGKVPAF